MEINKLRKHNNTTHTPTTDLRMHKDSKTISKPKIRIIHIFAPQIIKTDVENFRELVQSKTGKPSDAEKIMCCNIKKKKPTILAASSGTDQEYYSSRKSNGTNDNNSLIGGLSDDDDEKPKSKNKMKMERSLVKEEQFCIDEICSAAGGYLGGFSDLEEGFISELGGFPLLPLDCNNHVQGFEQESHSHLL